MPRSDRLLRLVQSLRRHRNPVTAELLAEELRVSVRTIYRDIGSLIETRVPIRGEVLSHPSGVEFRVLDADARRLRRLRVRKVEPVAEA